MGRIGPKGSDKIVLPDGWCSESKGPVPDKIVHCAGCKAQLTQPKVCRYCGREHTESLFDPRKTAMPRIITH